MNILEDLFCGNIRPCEKCYSKPSEYEKARKIFSENEKKLMAFLQDKEAEKAWFLELLNEQGTVSYFQEKDRFLEGFQLGARLILDTFLVPRESVFSDLA